MPHTPENPRSSSAALPSPPLRAQHRLETPPDLYGRWPSVAEAVSEHVASGSEMCAEVSSTVAVPAHELVDLYRKLQSQPLIEEAKGILMGYYGIDATAAFGTLKRWSQTNNVRISSIAQSLVEAAGRQPSTECPPHVVIERLSAP